MIGDPTLETRLYRTATSLYILAAITITLATTIWTLNRGTNHKEP